MLKGSQKRKRESRSHTLQTGWSIYPPRGSPHPRPILPTAAGMSPRTDVRLPLPPAGLSPHALAWQNPKPDIASTYFLSHVVHCSPFTNLTRESNCATHLHQMHSVFSHHGACPHSLPSVSHSCMSRLYTPSEVWDGKCVLCACSDRLAVFLCSEGFCRHTWAQWKSKGSIISTTPRGHTNLNKCWLKLKAKRGSENTNQLNNCILVKRQEASVSLSYCFVRQGILLSRLNSHLLCNKRISFAEA